VVVCNDGGDSAYIERALNEGILPNVARFMKTGFNAIAECVIPSFTCLNNVSIVTGSPLAPRHIREFLSRTADGKGGDYDRPRVDALDDHSCSEVPGWCNPRYRLDQNQGREPNDRDEP
jgi:hypothetical protein